MGKIFLFINEKLDQVVRSKWAPWIIFFVAIATRTAGAMMGGVRSDDEDGTYTGMAMNYLAGRGLTLTTEYGTVYSWLPPGMGLLNIVFMSLFGQERWQVRIIFVLMSAAANVGLFYLAKKLVEDKFAWIAAIYWALYPAQWFWASRINPQVYPTNMVLFCLLLLFKGWEKKNFIVPVIVGALWVSLTLCRGEYALGIGAFALASLFAFPLKRDGFLFGSLLILGWALAFSPWVYRNYKIHDRFVLIATNTGYNFWKAYNKDYNFHGEDIPIPPEIEARLQAEKNEADRSEILKKEGMVFIRENPLRAARNVAGNLLHFWRPWLSPKAVGLKTNIVYVVSYVPMFIFFVLALFKIPWKDPRWMAIGGLLFYKWMIHSPFYIIVRYREAIMPLIALVAAYGLSHYWKKAVIAEKTHV